MMHKISAFDLKKRKHNDKMVSLQPHVYCKTMHLHWRTVDASDVLRITLELDCDLMELIKLIHNGIQLNNIKNTTFNF